MSLLAGSITVNGDGTYTGTGRALGLDPGGRRARQLGWLHPSDGTSALVESRKALAYFAAADAAAIVAHLTANGLIPIPINAGTIDSGVPSVNRTFTGTLT